MSMSLNAQNLEQHQWKDRLLVIVSVGLEDEIVQHQLAMLREDEQGLKERRLVVYQLTPEYFKKGVNAKVMIAMEKPIPDRFSLTNSAFMIYLVGLDGGIKLESPKTVTLKEIFALIDTMPMRRAELARKKKQSKQED